MIIVCVYNKKIYYKKNGSQDYKGWSVLQSVNWRPKKAVGTILVKHWCIGPSLRIGEYWCSSSSFQVEREFYLPPPFGSIQSLNQLENVHPHWGRQPALLRLSIQMLFSYRITFTGSSRNNVKSNIWASCDPLKLTHKINHYRLLVSPWFFGEPHHLTVIISLSLEMLFMSTVSLKWLQDCSLYQDTHFLCIFHLDKSWDCRPFLGQ